MIKYMSVMSAYFRIGVRVLNRISLLDMYVVRAYDVIKINNLKYMAAKKIRPAILHIG